MSGIVLSASVRQNLLSLQSTAALLATTQNDLATGNKVNSALDNPTEFFTAQALNSRASDISNLLDGIGNGVQVLQAANTGITSLQSLIANAQSIANQVLQAPTGYSTKSSVTATAITGATANNLLGPSTANTVTGTTMATTHGRDHRCDPTGRHGRRRLQRPRGRYHERIGSDGRWKDHHGRRQDDFVRRHRRQHGHLGRRIARPDHRDCGQLACGR